MAKVKGEKGSSANGRERPRLASCPQEIIAAQKRAGQRGARTKGGIAQLFVRGTWTWKPSVSSIFSRQRLTPQSRGGFVHILCWISEGEEHPFTLGNGQGLLRMNDYSLASFPAACTDFCIGEAVKYLPETKAIESSFGTSERTPVRD